MTLWLGAGAALAVLALADVAHDRSRVGDRAAIAAAQPRVDYAGGPFLRRPQLVTVTFAGDSPAIVASLEAFADAVGGSSWWRAVFAERCAAPGDCMGEPAPARAVRVPRRLPARIHAVDVEAWLTAAAVAGELGTRTPESLLLVYLPPGTQLTDGMVGRYCGAGPRAYHRAAALPAGRLAFAVIPRCGDMDATTTTASHEIVEAVTNPDPARPGFRLSSSPLLAGFRAAGAEPADPCGALFRRGDAPRVEGRWAVHRAWSNEAATAGEDPCVPDGNRPFVAVVPREARVRVTRDVPAVVSLDARASAATSSWAVTAEELVPRGAAPALRVSLDRAVVEPGAVLHVTLRLRGPLDGHRVVTLVSTYDGATSAWPLIVVP